MPTLDFSDCEDDTDKRISIYLYMEKANSITHDGTVEFSIFLRIFRKIIILPRIGEFH